MTSRYQRDFDFVSAAIEDGYVSLLEKEREWDFNFSEVRQRCAQRLPDVGSDPDFWHLLKEVVAPLHDGHTHVGWNAPFVAGAQRFGLPFTLCHIGGRYYVNTWREDIGAVPGIDSGDRVAAVGGYSIQDLQEVYARYEGHSTRHAQRAALASAIPFVFQFFLPGCDLESPVEIDLVTRDGRAKTHRVFWIAIPPPAMQRDPRRVFTHRWLRRDPPIAILRADGFFFPDPDDRRIIRESLDALFSEIRTAEGLVLDIRACGGGLFGPMAELVARLAQEPVPNFKRRWFVSENFRKYHEWGHRFPEVDGFTDWEYDGDPDRAMIHPAAGRGLPKRIPIVALTGCGTVSRGEQLARMLQETGIARTLGETTAGADAGPLQVSLPETGWSFSYSVVEIRSPQGYNIEGKGVIADIPFSLAPADSGTDRDRYLEEAEKVLVM